MALKAFAETLRLLVITPYVWICGIFAAISILGFYYTEIQFGILYAIPLGLICLFIMPAFLAGSYGIILENHGSPKVYLKYIRYGYFKCLLPMLLVLLIGWVAYQAITYLLLMIGLSAEIAMYFGLFIILPIIFFWYFADLCAMLGARGIFGSLKASARRVMAGSFSVTAFYLFNIALFFLLDFLFSLILSFFIPENALSGTLLSSGMSETELMTALQNMTSEQLLEYMTSLLTPEMLSAFAFTGAICAFIAVPLFTTYKVCYFKRLLAATLPRTDQHTEPAPQTEENPEENTGNTPTEVPAPAPTRAPLPPNDPHAGEDGEYDAKGRWFKYT